MAELALIASIVQVADVGLRLSLRLYTFGETVASADRSILAISKDVSLTSAVLKELGLIFEDDKGRIHSDNATKTAEAVVQECSDVFQEMDRLLLKKVSNLKPGFMDKKARAKAVLERLRWPSIKGKIELLNCNLDRMKSTLTLMLNVIIYAQQVSKRTESASVIAEQRQLIEILAQAKEERDKALEQAKRAVEYKSVEPSNDIPYLTAMNFMAMSVGVEKSELSQGSSNSPLVPSQPRTLPTELDNSSHLDQLLDEYTRLQKNLIDEINSEQYKIQQDSRKRLKLRVDNAHNEEVHRLTVISPCYYDANGVFKKSRKRNMQPTRVGGLTEKDAENLQHVEISDDFESKHDDRTSNSSSEQSDLTAITPKLLASEPEFKTNEDKPLPPQPKSILRKPRDNFPEYPTTIREGVAPHPSQPSKKPLQPIENQAEVSIKRQARRLSPATKDSLLPNTDYSSVEVRHRSSILFDTAQTKTKPAEPILIRAESMYETRTSLASELRTADHRLSVIEEDHPPASYSQPPAETAEPKRPHNRPFSRRFVGKPPRYSNGQNPPRYAFGDVTGPKGEKFADLRAKASISSFSRVPVFRFLFTLRMPAITRWKPPATPKKPLTARAVKNWMRETDDDPVTHPRVDTFPPMEEGYYYERRTHLVDSMVQQDEHGHDRHRSEPGVRTCLPKSQRPSPPLAESHTVAENTKTGQASAFPSSKPKRPRRACDNCYRAKIRCGGGAPCTSCLDSGGACTYSISNRIGRPKGVKTRRTMRLPSQQTENKQEQTDDIPILMSSAACSSLAGSVSATPISSGNLSIEEALYGISDFLSPPTSSRYEDAGTLQFGPLDHWCDLNGGIPGILSRSTFLPPNNARNMGRKDSDVVSEHRDSRDMGESNYNGAPPKRHDRYTVADLGAHDMDFDLGMALYVDKRGIEGLAKIGKRMEEDEKEESQEAEEEPLEEEGEEAVEQVEEEAVKDKSEEPQVEHYEEANFFNSEQSWNWWGKEVPDETVKIKERKEHANAGHEASVVDRLLAAWTTVKPVI